VHPPQIKRIAKWKWSIYRYQLKAYTKREASVVKPNRSRSFWSNNRILSTAVAGSWLSRTCDGRRRFNAQRKTQLNSIELNWTIQFSSVQFSTVYWALVSLQFYLSSSYLFASKNYKWCAETEFLRMYRVPLWRRSELVHNRYGDEGHIPCGRRRAPSVMLSTWVRLPSWQTADVHRVSWPRWPATRHVSARALPTSREAAGRTSVHGPASCSQRVFAL